MRIKIDCLVIIIKMYHDLDFNKLNKKHFKSIADHLLNHCYLLANKSAFRLVEIEFYLKCDSHSDPYTHCLEDQQKLHTFYFHKFKNGTYKSGTFKGMDLVFGSKEDNAYFGILVRSVQDMQTGEIIQGPCNAVNRLLKECKKESIMDLTKGRSIHLFNNKNLKLVESDDLEKIPMARGPRIGLSDKYPEYQNRNYRYVIHHQSIKKAKKSLQLI